MSDHSESSSGSSPRTAAWRVLGGLGIGCLFAWLCVAGFPGVEDLNPEAIDTPLTVACLRKAVAAGVPFGAWLRSDPAIVNVLQENPWGTTSPGYHGRLSFEHFIYSLPLEATLFHPFVQILGLSVSTGVAYSTFFLSCAMALAAWLALRLFGWREAGLTALCLLSSLGWLIHAKIGYPQHPPSVALMVLLALALHAFARNNSFGAVLACGGILGILYMTAWIGFGYGLLLTALGLLFLGRGGTSRVIVQGATVALVAALVATLGVFLIATWVRVEPFEIHRGVLQEIFGRYRQGEPALSHLGIGTRMAYAARCLFLDSQTLDGHVDKYLEGHPAIPWLFSALFVLGLLYAIRDRTRSDQLILLWLVAVFVPLGTVYIFAHRYAILGLPAMAILAARGGVALRDDLARSGYRVAGKILALLLIVGMGLSIFATREAYFVDYRLHKPANFELDRLRGHAALTAWLKTRAKPSDTLVVLGDPVMFPHTDLLFHTFEDPYRFVFWSNRFWSLSRPEQVIAWEREIPRECRRIVYAFSTLCLSHSWFRFGDNDWSAFLAAHPGLPPAWSYSYDGRSPSIVAWEILRPESLRETGARPTQPNQKSGGHPPARR